MDRWCEWCGASLPHTKRPHARFCNRSCKSSASSARRYRADPEHRRRLRDAWRRRRPDYVAPSYAVAHDRSYRTSSRTCKQCSASFLPAVHNQVHCSFKCKKAWAAARYEPKRTERKNRRAREQYQTIMYGRPLSPEEMTRDRFRAARAQGYRSGLEVAIARHLESLGVPFQYEAFRVPFVQPAKPRKYCPDFVLPSGIVIEAKGIATTQDRQKLLMVKEQHPDIDLRLVFSNSRTRISKQSRTTYAMWCETHAIPYADKLIPDAWLREKPNKRSLAAIHRLLKEHT